MAIVVMTNGIESIAIGLKSGSAALADIEGLKADGIKKITLNIKGLQKTFSRIEIYPDGYTPERGEEFYDILMFRRTH